ncbi:SIMPL domain-containing protein [Shewanella abyssi]|uniref:SIMPL domain-containing protein n=1 Tax=Shewanella abyssi TaxID=311789 RepID=UPI00200CE928|nr:SIMPL domain-containing protein [Shewanella abyssi]
MKIFISLILILLPFASSASPIPDFPFIIVTEEIEEKIKPDRVEVSFAIVAFDKSSKVAVQQLSQATSHVIDLLKEHQIELAQLESNQMNKHSKRARKDGVYDLEILGYNLEQSFTLTLTDLAVYPVLMNQLIMVEGVEGLFSHFSTSKETELQSTLLQKASLKVRIKADVLAEAQSRRVKSVYGITTEGSIADAYGRFSLSSSAAFATKYRLGSSHTSSDFMMTVPNSITLRQEITAVYELE